MSPLMIMFLRRSTILEKFPEDSFLSMVYGSWIRLEFLKGNVLNLCNGLGIKNVGCVILFHVIIEYPKCVDGSKLYWCGMVRKNNLELCGVLC